MIMMRTKIDSDNNYINYFIDDDIHINVKQIFELMVITVIIKTAIVLLIPVIIMSR